MGSPGLHLSTDHLYILTMGYQESLSNDNVVLYDPVELANSAKGILVAEYWKIIISPILNFIIQNKIYWFNVGGLFIFLPTDWYHTAEGIYKGYWHVGV